MITMEPQPTRDEARVHIDAPPERVYALISDITRMGEWSPECYRCRWLGGASGAAVGARFKGYNRHGIRWTNKSTVIAAEPGQEFAFHRIPMWRLPGGGEVVWRYRILSAGNGTELIESYEAVKPQAALMYRMTRPLRADQPDRASYLRHSMQTTLERIKAAAEGAP